MSLRWLSCLVALGNCAFAAERPALTTVMYLVNRPASISSFQNNWQSISIIAPQCFTMDADGFVSGEVPPAVVETARAHGIAVMPLVTNRRFNQDLMHSVLDSPEARARAIRYLLYYSLRDGYLGIQFDYENIKYTYRDRFSDFFHEAAIQFHKHGLLLTAAVVGKYSDDRNSESPGGYDNWSGVYDYPRLGRDADFLSIMAYPQHAAFSGPGPLAGLPWVERIVEFTRSHLPAEKISLGVPLYGFHWIAAKPGDPWKGRTSLYPDTAKLIENQAPEWQSDQSAHRVTYSDDAGQHELWYEDARSVGSKLQLAAAQGLAGVSGWALGQEDPAAWKVISKEYRVRRPKTKPVRGSFEDRSKAAARLINR